MSCGYCNASIEDLKLCQLSPDYNTSKKAREGKREWQYPKWICKSCRQYLKGYFRICRETEVEKYGF